MPQWSDRERKAIQSGLIRSDARLRAGRRGYEGGTLQAQAAILIHELAHLQNANHGAKGFKAEAGDKQAGRDNDKLVDQNGGRPIGDVR